MSNSSLTLTSLDFDTLKSSFVDFLKAQTVFKDYNFEGSNINVLLDVLAYNSYLNSFYLNMAVSEMFLDSAQKIDSVISHAKELNYTPRSTRSARANITFDIDTTGVVNPLVIPKGTIFSGENANGGFTFVTDSEHSYLSSNTTYQIVELDIFEGSYVQDAFVMDYSQETQKFILSNPRVDTGSIEVNVSVNNGQSNSDYAVATTLYGLTNTSEVYFIQATSDGKYEIVFGDGVFGARPQNGAVVIVTYRVSAGSDGNGIESFTIDQDIGAINGGTSTFSEVTVNTPSISGANSEDIESIRYNAPRHYQTQGRCVTSSDYVTAVTQSFPEIQHVNVYGGGVSNTAVEYGKVYVSVSTYSGHVLTNTRKTDIQTHLNALSPLGITTKVIDPEYLYVVLDSVVYANLRTTRLSATAITSKVTAVINTFNQSKLQNFNTAFRLSKLEQAINEADTSILSNETTTQLFRVFTPVLDIAYPIYCNLSNEIKAGSVYSSEFSTGGKSYILTDTVAGTDTGTGKLYIVEQNIALSTPSFTEVGTVDYTTGVINVSQQKYHEIGGGLKIYGTPVKKDLYCTDNTIIEIDTVSGITLSVVDTQ